MNEPKLKKSELLALESIIESMKENNETNLAFIGSISKAASSVGRAVATSAATGAAAAVGESFITGTGVTKAAEAAGAAVGDSVTAAGVAVAEASATSELAALAEVAAGVAVIAALSKQADIDELKPIIDVLKNTALMNTSFSLKELEDLRDKLKGFE